MLATGRGLVVRLSMLFGPALFDRASFFDQAVADLRSGTPRAFFDDEFRTPLDYVSAARLLIRLAVGDATGIIHAGGPERLSRFELMRRAATALGAEAGLVRANRRADVPTPSPDPRIFRLIRPGCAPLFRIWCCPRSSKPWRGRHDHSR